MKTLFYFIYLLRQQFFRPFPWVLLALIWCLIGYIIALIMEQTRQANLSTAIWWMSFFSLLLTPQMTHNLFFKKGRPELFLLLRTSGLNPYLASLSHFGQKLAFFLLLDLIFLYPLWFLSHHSDLDTGLSMAGLLGLILLQMAYLSVGICIAALSNSSVQAGLLTLLALLLSWLLFYCEHLLSQSSPNLALVLKEMSLFKHFYLMLTGSFTLSDILALALLPPLMLLISGVCLKR